MDARTVRRRRGLPTGRAVVGGFLVAASAVAVFAAYANASAVPSASYVIAKRPVSVGQRITAAELGVVALDLPAAQRGRAFTDVGVVAGAVALGPIAPGELIQAASVAKPDGDRGSAQISFPVEGASALGGQLKPGEQVDVIVTYGSGDGAIVSTIARGALLVRVETGSDRLGSSGAVTVVVAVDPGALEDIAKASAAGRLTVARTTGTYSDLDAGGFLE
jgi:Flp pilus assembly protein CpaB